MKKSYECAKKYPEKFTGNVVVFSFVCQAMLIPASKRTVLCDNTKNGFLRLLDTRDVSRSGVEAQFV